MPGTGGIGNELDHAPRHADRTTYGPASHLVRLTHIDQHDVTIMQLCSQLGGS